MSFSWSDLGKEIAKFAPAVGEAVTGNIPGAIASVANALGTSADPQSISQAVKNDPQAVIKLKQLDVQMKQIAATTEQAKINSKAQEFESEQKTFQANQQYGTDYVKNTRPGLARKSFWAGTIYILGLTVAHAASPWLGNAITGPDVVIASALYSPCIGYCGMRTAETFSRWGKTK